jgi:hypothetical protein
MDKISKWYVLSEFYCKPLVVLSNNYYSGVTEMDELKCDCQAQTTTRRN